MESSPLDTFQKLLKFWERRKGENIVSYRCDKQLPDKIYDVHTGFQMNPNYVPGEVETRQVYGVSLQQRRNDAKIDTKLFDNIVSKSKDVRFPSLSTAFV